MGVTEEDLESLGCDEAYINHVGAAVSAAYLILMKAVSAEQFVVSEADIARLNGTLEDIRQRHERLSSQAMEVVSRRRQNLIKYSGLKIISLGVDCFPRTILTRWGLKPFAALGEASHPFDLAVHPLACIPDLLSSRFAGYMDVENLLFLESHLVVRNRKFGITFNHEIGAQYAEESFRELRHVYARRVTRLGDDVASANKLIYVLHIQRPNATDHAHLERLKCTLLDGWRLMPGCLIVINTHPHGTGYQRATVSRVDSFESNVDIDHPFEGYVWHTPHHCFSAEGHSFEKDIILSVEGIAEKIL